MNEASGYGSESTEDSNDMLWETIKVDLGLNRACQTEQLQSLKGLSVKLSPSKRKVRKHAKRSLKHRKRFHSKKAAIKTALCMIRAVTRKIRFGRKVSNGNNGYTSVMNFKVLDYAPKIVVGNKPVSPPVTEHHSLPVNEISATNEDCGNNVEQGPVLKDEATQTTLLSLEEKSSQTSIQENSNSDLCDVANSHITIQPKSCGRAFVPSCACCSKPVINVFPCSGLQQEREFPQQTCRQMEASHASKRVPDGSLGTQYTLKQICEELLFQFSTRRENFADKQRTEENNNVRDCSAGTSTTPSNTAVSNLKAVVHSLENAQSDLQNNMVAHQQVGPTIIRTARSETQCAPPAVQSKTMCLKPVPEEKRMTPKSASTISKSVLSCVTPDLLQLAGDCTRFRTSPPPEGQRQDAHLFKVPSPPKKIEQQKGLAGKMDCLESINGPTIISLEENSNKLLQEMLAAGLVTIIHSEDKTENIPSNIIQNENDSVKNSSVPTDCKTGNQINSSPKSSVTNSLNSSEDFVLVMDAEENDQNMICNEEVAGPTSPQTNENNVPIINESKTEETQMDVRHCQTNELKDNACKANAISSTTSDDELAHTSEKDITRNNSDCHLNDFETTVPAKMNELNSQATEKMIKDSVAFEEMDASEMENILMVWRQQEQLHKDPHQKSPPSSQNFLFMTKKTRELPAELKNVRVFQPPPLRKGEVGISALQILNEKENEPAVVDEDDVPEVSPTVLPTPKKRRLSLKKNPPSPLPVVFHKGKQVTEDLKMIEDIPPIKDTGHSSPLPLPPAQVEENNDGVTSEIDDDSPLTTRLRKRKAISSVSKEKAVSVSGSSKKQDIAKKQTDVEKSSTDDKCSKKGKAQNVQQQTGLSKNGKIKKPEVPIEISAENKNQIKERFDAMNKKWLKDKSTKEVPEKDLDLVSQPTMPPPSVPSQLNQEQIFQEKIRMLREVSVYELGKAHDLAISILLNPWRGINARRATRDYEPPSHDNKCVSRSLWDLRSGASPDDIVNRIMSMGWKDVDLFALKSMVSMFVLSLVRTVPFIIEAAKIGEEDDTCSIVSDLDLNLKKKATSLRVVATRHIFKGECIDGLNGLFIKPSEKDKDKNRLRTWVFPKFKEGRNFVVLGPLAYLKRKEGNSNTEALILKGDVAIVKATRQILCGERLLVSFERLEKFLGSRI
ncbi:uncharacterized protein LOC117650308 isoform X2 [Thrips palmi]|uniref:Uncharacterized protein LOC117650308 isoform X2 n=1 Tax=Thrips palmi TaxID=161013 RepID=A0A6P8ZWN1_THRPL|nr:uncharacterized protein LOC117650308 isoform X2 [Thrips palmi]